MMTSSTNGNEASATPQGNRSSLQKRQRRTFAVGSLRFQCSRQRLLDAVIDCVSSSVEGFVYLIGPVLIILALLIMSLLTYTFFAIIIPMMDKKYELHPLKTLILALHSGFVVVLLVNILFNYAACVLHRHTGPQYDKVVRELAAATPDFDYPETPEELAIYKRDFSDRMVLRLRRRRARAEEAAAAANCTSSSDHSSTAAAAVPEGMVKRRAAPNAATPSASPRGKQQQATPPVVRGWMLLGPYEWSYCSNTNQPKPPRSHYDNVTGSLVLNLDHYCPWMFNASESYFMVCVVDR
jgi:palmitoyltransferase